MKFTVVTILPELIEPCLAAGVVGRAREAGTITVSTINPRDFTTDRHRSVDDTPYGGGPGMVMKPEPLLAAISKAEGRGEGREGDVPRRILLSPAGAPLTQQRVRELAQLPHLILVCGRYEGVDERVIEQGIDEEISIGDYVLSGGELGALVIIDAVSRFVPGVLGEAASTDEESHAAGLLEYPQYTRPAKLASGDQAEVPAVLLGGNHAAIAAWRRTRSIERTAQRRPDLFSRFAPTATDRKLLKPLAARCHIALVHHPVVDRTGKVVTTSMTNLDIHDIARSSLTFGLAGYHLITPVTVQREKAEYIAQLWADEIRTPPARGSRGDALALIRTASSIEDTIAHLTDRHGMAPLVVATSARPESFPEAPHVTPDQLVAEISVEPEPILLLLGTGWGSADSLMPSATRVLTPIEGASDWNHLSVRSAAAILLDRLFGRRP